MGVGWRRGRTEHRIVLWMEEGRRASSSMGSAHLPHLLCYTVSDPRQLRGGVANPGRTKRMPPPSSVEPTLPVGPRGGVSYGARLSRPTGSGSETPRIDIDRSDKSPPGQGFCHFRQSGLSIWRPEPVPRAAAWPSRSNRRSWVTQILGAHLLSRSMHQPAGCSFCPRPCFSRRINPTIGFFSATN